MTRTRPVISLYDLCTVCKLGVRCGVRWRSASMQEYATQCDTTISYNLFIYSLLHNFLQVRAKPCNLGKIVLKIRRLERVVGVQVPLPAPTNQSVTRLGVHVARTPATLAADAIAYNLATCSTGAMPTPQLSAENTMEKPCSPTWQASTPTQPRKPGNKN